MVRGRCRPVGHAVPVNSMIDLDRARRRGTIAACDRAHISVNHPTPRPPIEFQEFAFEIGEDRFTLKAGDSVVGPWRVPHVWAYTGAATGRILVAFTPAGAAVARLVIALVDWTHGG